MIYSNRLITDGKVRLPRLYNASYGWKIVSSNEGESYLLIVDKQTKEILESSFLPMPDRVSPNWQYQIVERIATSIYGDMLARDFNLMDTEIEDEMDAPTAPIIPLFG